METIEKSSCLQSRHIGVRKRTVDSPTDGRLSKPRRGCPRVVETNRRKPYWEQDLRLEIRFPGSQSPLDQALIWFAASGLLSSGSGCQPDMGFLRCQVGNLTHYGLLGHLWPASEVLSGPPDDFPEASLAGAPRSLMNEIAYQSLPR